MDKKIYVLTALIIIIVLGAAATAYTAQPLFSAAQATQQNLSFTVTGSNECLKFLTPTVKTAYVPFRTGAGEKWQLSIECPKMPGGKSAAADVYLYRGFWDNGANHTCQASDLYAIVSQIQSTENQIINNSTYTQTFGEATPQSYTVFFLLPVGGEGIYNVKLTKVS